MLTLAFLASDRGFLMPHSLNVCLLALNLSIELGYSVSEMEELALASLLHDMGMFVLPPELIYSPDDISREGRELLKQHPDQGWRRAQDLLSPNQGIIQAIYQEHEREDGSGYPEGVTGRAIHEFAKILGAVDVFEALTHPRPYRDRLSSHAAMREVITQGSRRILDRGMVKAFVNRTAIFPIGSFVELNTGEIAQVVEIKSGHPLSPVVEIVLSREGRWLHFRRSIDLSQEPIMTVVKVVDSRDIEPLKDMKGEATLF
jgi:HD-GYP domain-containing protein (c-di-GMP phosphodiesterase class II)